MSYCRFSNADAYIYEAEEGFTCCGCRIAESGMFVCETELEMIEHIAQHRKAGHFVPANVDDLLRDEVKMSEEYYEPELGQAVFGQPTKEYKVTWELKSGLEMIRHYLNIAFDLEGDPFGNSGADFKCSVFEVNSYSWNEDVEQPYNFKWRDLEVSWYKYFGRGMSVNRVPKVREIIEMVHECLDVLRSMGGKESEG